MIQVSQERDVYMDRVLAALLRGGVLLSAAVVLIGAAVFLGRHGSEPADYRVFKGEPGELRKPTEIVGQALAGHGRGMIQLGLLLLIATPVARVGFSVVAFARERDFLYVSFTVIVLALLLYSLLLGYSEAQ